MNKKITGLLFIIYCGLLSYSCYINNTLETGNKLEYLLIAFCTPWLLYLVFKGVKLKLTLPIIITNWVFCAFSTILGSTLGFYSYDYFDKILHFSSGLFISILCIMIYSLLHPLPMRSKRSCLLQLLFINGMNMLIAFLWELYEFSLLVFMDIDAVNHYTTGVFDSMGDLIVCFVGGLIISCFTYHYFKSQRINMVYKIVDDFKSLNHIKDSSL